MSCGFFLFRKRSDGNCLEVERSNNRKGFKRKTFIPKMVKPTLKIESCGRYSSHDLLRCFELN